jgi:hypothetical protein
MLNSGNESEKEGAPSSRPPSSLSYAEQLEERRKLHQSTWESQQQEEMGTLPQPLLKQDKNERIKDLYHEVATTKREICSLLPLNEAARKTFEFTNEYRQLLSEILDNALRIESLTEIYYQSLCEIFHEIEESLEDHIDFDLSKKIKEAFISINHFLDSPKEIHQQWIKYYDIYVLLVYIHLSFFRANNIILNFIKNLNPTHEYAEPFMDECRFEVIHQLMPFTSQPQIASNTVGLLKLYTNDLERIKPEEKLVEMLRDQISSWLNFELCNYIIPHDFSLMDTLYDALLWLTKLAPMNNITTDTKLCIDPITQCEIEEENNVVSSVGHQFDIVSLIGYHNSRDYRGSALQEASDEKYLLNPVSNLPFPLRDVVYIAYEANKKNIEILALKCTPSELLTLAKTGPRVVWMILQTPVLYSRFFNEEFATPINKCLVTLARSRPGTARLILSSESLCHHLNSSDLLSIVEEWPQFGVTILRTHYLSDKLVHQHSAAYNLACIAIADRDALDIILKTETLREKLNGRALVKIVGIYPDSAVFFLQNEEFYTKLHGLITTRQFLTSIGQANCDAAKLILQTEIFFTELYQRDVDDLLETFPELSFEEVSLLKDRISFSNAAICLKKFELLKMLNDYDRNKGVIRTYWQDDEQILILKQFVTSEEIAKLSSDADISYNQFYEFCRKLNKHHLFNSQYILNRTSAANLFMEWRKKLVINNGILPEEIWENIFSFLNKEELKNASLVCHKFNGVITHNYLLWNNAPWQIKNNVPSCRVLKLKSETRRELQIACVLPNGNFLLKNSDFRTRYYFWEVKSGRLKFSIFIRSYGSSVTALPNGDVLIVSSDFCEATEGFTIKVQRLDVETGELSPFFQKKSFSVLGSLNFHIKGLMNGNIILYTKEVMPGYLGLWNSEGKFIADYICSEHGIPAVISNVLELSNNEFVTSQDFIHQGFFSTSHNKVFIIRDASSGIAKKSISANKTEFGISGWYFCDHVKVLSNGNLIECDIQGNCLRILDLEKLEHYRGGDVEELIEKIYLPSSPRKIFPLHNNNIVVYCCDESFYMVHISSKTCKKIWEMRGTRIVDVSVLPDGSILCCTTNGERPKTTTNIYIFHYREQQSSSELNPQICFDFEKQTMFRK